MTDTLAQALLAVQREMPAIEPDAVNPHFRSKFVSLDHLLAVTLPVLHRNGIVLVQMPSTGLDGTPALTTVLLHESGDQVSGEMPLILPKNDPQGQGSALTYARRYALSAALGISAERDDDAESATASQEQASRMDRMREKIAQMSLDADKLAKRDKGSTWEEIAELIVWRANPDGNIEPYSSATDWDSCTEEDLEFIGRELAVFIEQGAQGSLFEQAGTPF
jgi:hypothetical protein